MQLRLKRLQYIISALDIVMLSIAYMLAYLVRFHFLEDGVVGGDYLELYGIATVLFVVILYVQDKDLKEWDLSLVSEFVIILKQHAYLGLSLFACLFVMKSGLLYSRLQMFLFLGMSLLFVFVERTLCKRYMIHRIQVEQTGEQMILVTSKSQVEAELERFSKMWYCSIIGICMIDEDMTGQYIQNVKVVANKNNMLEVIAKENVDSVLICCSKLSHGDVASMVEQLQAAGITAHVHISEAELSNGFKTYNTFGEYSVMTYTIEKNNMQMRFLSRVIDLCIGLIGSFLCVITYPLLAFIIKVTTKGPTCIARVRVGRNGRRFTMYTYRTIADVAGNVSVVGKVLEKTGLHNLPVFFALLWGHVTILGKPAPSLTEFMTYTPGQRKSMGVKPGVFSTFVKVTEKNRKEQILQLQAWNESLIPFFQTDMAKMNLPQQKVAGKATNRIRCYRMLKRLMDCMISLLALVLASPIWLLIYLLVFLFDGHNPIYSQLRVGKDGRKIRIYKYRSMKHQSDDLERLLTPEQLEQYKREFKLENDPRVTAIGRFLRRTSLDEIPQLLNVLKGDIALIGPRPILDTELLHYGENVELLLSVKPGLTGYWQAYARNNATYETGERQKMELYYVTHECPSIDLKILLKTITTVLTGDGAM